MSADQEDWVPVSTSAIVGRKAFRKGVQDYVDGIAPDFDKHDDDYFAYERGRQFAALCRAENRGIPPNRTGRCVNLSAIYLFDLFGGDIR